MRLESAEDLVTYVIQIIIILLSIILKTNCKRKEKPKRGKSSTCEEVRSGGLITKFFQTPVKIVPVWMSYL